MESTTVALPVIGMLCLIGIYTLFCITYTKPSEVMIYQVLSSNDTQYIKGAPLLGVNLNTESAHKLGRYLLDLDLDDSKINTTLYHIAINDIHQWNESQGSSFAIKKHDFRVRCAAPRAGQSPRHVYVLRHTESVSAITDWMELAFDAYGDYYINDLNLPKVLPYRNGYPHTFADDPPLTVNGHVHAWLIGHAFLERNLTLSHIYAAPSMKCIETANTLIKGLGSSVQINIEPGVMGRPWDYRKTQFLTEEELYWYNMSINTLYKPTMALDRIDHQEDTTDEYDRAAKTIRKILRAQKKAGIDEGDILIVSDLATTETITRYLVNETRLDDEKFMRILKSKPPGIMTVVQEECQSAGWRRVRPPIPPYTARHIKTYKWTFMLLNR